MQMLQPSLFRHEPQNPPVWRPSARSVILSLVLSGLIVAIVVEVAALAWQVLRWAL